ncbi:MAG: L,D-transpeptidase [Coxiellaceae bacterium]|nr:L,D-transpeptidase [Coxiellaceae bacterium]|tara:strand:+ start:382 stop:1218 length:837 start_codon:yes stop_codon:yes gene_type:complete
MKIHNILSIIGGFAFCIISLPLQAESTAAPWQQSAEPQQSHVLAMTQSVQNFTSEYINPMVYANEHTLADSPHYAQQLCQLPGYHCRSVKPGDSWASLWPDYSQRQIIMRLNRTNVALSYLSWVVVPDDMNNINYMSLSPMPFYRKPSGHKDLVVNLGMYAFGAYDETGKLVYWGPVTSGAPICPESSSKSCKTVVGTFKVYRKQGAACISHTYPLETRGGASMPYCMHFYKGFAIHGSTLAGFYNHSQGCVRLFYDDAKWLNEEFANLGTAVIIQSA